MKNTILALILSFLLPNLVFAVDLKVNDPAPVFKAKTHTGVDFDLASRKGKWTVLYFYPKAGTPGCTEQACTFRDAIEKIKDLNADVFGVSTDSVKDQAAFHKAHNLSFTLIADEDQNIMKLYGSKMPILNMSKRWTFILDPDLIIRHIDREANPKTDAKTVVDTLTKLKKGQK